MIGYSPIDFYEPVPAQVQVQAPEQPRKIPKISECNYIVMFFIIGVILLAITDLLGKQTQ